MEYECKDCQLVVYLPPATSELDPVCPRCGGDLIEVKRKPGCSTC